ncbi:MAG: hypothetical protein ACLRWM_13485 [Streptococcus sp.]
MVTTTIFSKTMTFQEKEDMEKKEKSNLSIKFPEGKTMTVFRNTPKHSFSIAY